MHWLMPFRLTAIAKLCSGKSWICSLMMHVDHSALVRNKSLARVASQGKECSEWFWGKTSQGFQSIGAPRPASPWESLDGIKILALAAVVQWTESRPVNQRVTSSIPSQGTCLGCGPGPQ